MAEEQTALQRWGSKRTPWWVWVVLLLVVVPAIVVTVVWVAGLGDSVQERRAELNERYVEPIDIRSVPDGGGGYEDLIVVDGTSRYDCTEDDGVLSCSEDPQPTEQ